MKRYQLPIDDLLKEIELRAHYRARAKMPGNAVPLEVANVTEAEHDLLAEMLRETTIEVRLILETFLTTDDPYAFDMEGDVVRYDITPPEGWNESKMDVFCLMIKTVLMHGTLAKWYANVGDDGAAMVEQAAADKKGNDLRTYRLKTNIRKNYTFI